LIWAVDQFGEKLTTPDCGNITAADPNGDKKQYGKRDAMWIKEHLRFK
jgi:alpha,alpha-trehalase